MSMFPTLEGVVAYPSGAADGEKAHPLVLRLLLYSFVELFLIPVYHAFKNPPGSVSNIGRIIAHARRLKNPWPIFDAYSFLGFLQENQIDGILYIQRGECMVRLAHIKRDQSIIASETSNVIRTERLLIAIVSHELVAVIAD